VRVTLFTSAFCDPCIRTRAVLDDVQRLVPAAQIEERDVARDNVEAELAGIRSTPTVIVAGQDGEEAFRAQGVPTVNQVLAALARAL
jgi:predicted DsbA family dithiol-disulfide isomerase